MVFKKGNIPHNKGKTKENYEPLKVASDNIKESKEKFFKTLQGQEFKEKVRVRCVNLWKNRDYRENQIQKRIGKVSHRKRVSLIEEYGLEKAKEISQKISRTLSNDNNPTKQTLNTINLFFNNIIKLRIKEKYNYICQLCKKYTEKLCVHHIDYNKENNNEENLVPLCMSCHGKTNGRKGWKYQIVFESGMFQYNHFIPEKSNLWNEVEYNNFVKTIHNPFKYDTENQC